MSILNPFPPVDEAAWHDRIRAALKGATIDSLNAVTDDGIVITPLSAGSAGTMPLSGMAAPWTVAARVDQPDPVRGAEQAIDDLMGGADGLNLVFAGGAAARGFGLPVADPAMLDRALAGVELDLIAVRLDGPSLNQDHVQCFATVVRARRLDPTVLRLDFGLDPIGQRASTANHAMTWPETAHVATAGVLSLAEQGFRGPFFVADGRPWHDAGATEAQELAALLATAMACARLLAAAGWPLDRALAAIAFVVPVDADLLVATAKIRALKRLWQHVAIASGISDQPAVIHAETSWRMLTRQDPQMNILRNGLAAFAAVTAGVSSLSVLPHTAAQGLPDGNARRHARNIQLLLKHEIQAWRLVDPAAGSGTFEALTQSLVEAAWTRFQALEARNAAVPGIVAALVDGSFAAEIAAAATARQAQIASGERRIIGVTQYVNESGIYNRHLTPSSGTSRHLLPTGEGGDSGTSFPAPVGRRWREAPDEGAGDDRDIPTVHENRLPAVRIAAAFEEAADGKFS
jgi:methylmalonyl-CoA mutase